MLVLESKHEPRNSFNQGVSVVEVLLTQFNFKMGKQIVTQLRLTIDWMTAVTACSTKINLFFLQNRQLASVYLLIYLTTSMHQSSSLMAKVELMQGCPDPVLKCPEQAQSDRKPSGIVSL